MELTLKQQEALTLAVSRYMNGEAYTCISGYAGAGKTTLIKFIVSALGLQNYEVCYIAYTGKAALVLQEKGCPNAMTAHRLLYISHPKADGTFFHLPRRPLPPYKLIVCDEVSMLPKDMWDLLLSHHIHVLALGDPAQLPPITEDNDVLSSPHIFLDEIVRQAQDNEIIKLSMDIREGKPLQVFKGKQVQVINKSDIVDGMYTWADQIICAKNETRRQINDYMRQKLFGVNNHEPIEGDKVICLRNNWDDVNGLGDCMVNGTVGTVSYIRYSHDNKYLKPYLEWDFLPDGYIPSQCSEDPYFRNLNVDYKLLTTGEPTVTTQNFRKFPKIWTPKEFDYGYCITCWKAQGDQYNKVLLFEEGFPFDPEEHQRYLYTGVTRAVEKLVVVKK